MVVREDLKSISPVLKMNNKILIRFNRVLVGFKIMYIFFLRIYKFFLKMYMGQKSTMDVGEGLPEVPLMNTQTLIRPSGVLIFLNKIYVFFFNVHIFLKDVHGVRIWISGWGKVINHFPKSSNFYLGYNKGDWGPSLP